MSRPHKYGEPTTRLEIRVPQSRKEEIRELVRGALNGDDGWVSVEDELPEVGMDVLAFRPFAYDYYDDCYTMVKYLGYYRTDISGRIHGFDRNHYVSHWMIPQPPKSK